MDDIVTRLREAHQKILPDWYCNNLRFDACYEIERLRTELADWQRTVRALEADNKCLREWAEYEHAGDCRCCGSDKECLDKALNYVKETFCG